jgi:integrase
MDERDGVWRVTVRGVRYNLGPSKTAAEKKFHSLMASESRTANQSLAVVLDEFLEWSSKNRAPQTTERYKEFCQSFLDHVDDMPLDRLTRGHVHRWLAQRTTWNQTTQHNAATAIVRALNWAHRNLGVPNPLSGMEKPTSLRRTSYVTPEEFACLLAALPADDPFLDLIVVSYDSGARPRELKQLEARHVDLGKCRAVIPTDEAKRGIQRAIYFPTERCLAVVARLVETYPEGPLFRNSRGRAWNDSSVKIRFTKLHNAGLTPRRLRHYDFRHAFVTRQLVAGVDSHVVARLAGHQNTNMLDRHYSHIADDYRFMLNEARRGAGDGAAAGDAASSLDSGPDSP